MAMDINYNDRDKWKHFERLEILLQRRRKVLAGFENCPPSELYVRLQDEVNLAFYKAAIEHMRGLVESYDMAFNKETDNADTSLSRSKEN